MSVKSIKAVKKVIKYMKKEGFDTSALAFVENLLSKHIGNKNTAQASIDFTEILAKDIRKNVSKGKKLADLSKLKIDRDFLLKVFDDICDLSMQYSNEKAKQIEKLKQGVYDGEVDLQKVQGSLVCDGKYLVSISAKLGIEEDLIYSIFLSVFRPMFESYIDQAEGLLKGLQWLYGCCPVCGSLPGMSKFETETGRRILWCPVCGKEWEFKRMRCPFCENDDQTTLGFFFLDEESPYRVDFCNKCKTYIKNIDERKVEREDFETIFIIEYLRTTDLDKLAKEEGFKARNEVKHKLKRRCK